jgi:hypothetical protein
MFAAAGNTLTQRTVHVADLRAARWHWGTGGGGGGYLSAKSHRNM